MVMSRRRASSQATLAAQAIEHKRKPRRLLSHFAAVDADNLTREERCLVGCEKYDGLGDLIGPTHAFEWHTRYQAGLPVGRAGEPAQHFGIDRPRGHRVDAYAGRCRFE